MGGGGTGCVLGVRVLKKNPRGTFSIHLCSLSIHSYFELLWEEQIRKTCSVPCTLVVRGLLGRNRF